MTQWQTEHTSNVLMDQPKLEEAQTLASQVFFIPGKGCRYESNISEKMVELHVVDMSDTNLKDKTCQNL